MPTMTYPTPASEQTYIEVTGAESVNLFEAPSRRNY